MTSICTLTPDLRMRLMAMAKRPFPRAVTAVRFRRLLCEDYGMNPD
jgi:hypothetical protein